MSGPREVGVRLKVGTEGTENLQRLGQALQKLGVDTDALDREAAGLAQQLVQTGEGAGKAAIDADKLADVQQEASAAAKQLAEAAKQAAGGTSDLAGSSQEAKAQLAGMKLELAAAGATVYTIGRALGGAAKDASAFESAMAEVSTLVSDTSSMDEQASAVRRLAREYGGDAKDQAKALYQIISAGAEQGAEAIGILDQANKLAVGGVTDITTAATGLTGILNAYGLEADKSGEVSDALFATMKDGVTTIGELSGSIGQVAPIAATAGVGFQELLAATGALTKGNSSTSASVTQLRAIISSVIKPTGEAAEVARTLGLQFDAQALKAKGLSGFLKDVAEKTGGNAETMAQLFGSIEAVNGVFSLTGKQAGDFARNLDSVNNSAGNTDEALAKITGTSEFAAKQFNSALSDIRISLGNTITSLTPLLRLVNQGLEAFNGLDESVKRAALGIGAVALAAGPVLSAMTNLTRATRLAAQAIGLKSAAAAGVAGPALAAAGATATLGTVSGAAATGIGAAAGATTALRTALGLLLRVLGPIGIAVAFFSELVDRAKKRAEELEGQVDTMLKGPDRVEVTDDISEVEEGLDRAGKAAEETSKKLAEQAAAARVAAKALGVDLARSAGRVTEEFGAKLKRLDEVVAGLQALKAEGVDAGALVSDSLRKIIDSARNTEEIDALRGKIVQLGTSGKISEGQVQDLMKALEESARKAGAGLDGLTEAARKAGVSIESLTGGLSKTGEQGVKAVSGLIDEIVKARLAAEVASPVLAAALLKRVQAAATAEEVAKLREQIDRAASSGKLFGTDLEKALDAVKRKAQELSPAFQQAAADARRLGIELSAGLERSAESGLRAYERLKLSGQASAKQIEQAFVNLANEQIKAADGVVPEWVKVEAAIRGAVLKTDEYGKVTVLTFKQAAEEAEKAARATGEIGRQAQASGAQVRNLADDFGRLASGAVSAGNAVREALQASGGGGFGLLSGNYIAQRNASINSTPSISERFNPQTGLLPVTSTGSIYTAPPSPASDYRWIPDLRNPRGGTWQLTPAAQQRNFAERQARLGLVPDTRPGFQGGWVRAPGTPGNGAAGVPPFGTAGQNASMPSPAPPPFTPTPQATPAEAELEQRIFVAQQQTAQALQQQQTAQAQLLQEQLVQLQAELVALRAGRDGRLSPSSVIEIRIPQPGDQPLRVYADGSQAANQFTQFLQRTLENAFRANGGALWGG